MGSDRAVRWSRSVRFGLTATATAIVALALAGGAIGLVTILRDSLERGVTDTAVLRADDVGALAKAGTLPSSLAFPGEERSIIQVIAPSGAVLAATANVAGEPALSPPGVKKIYTSDRLPVGDHERFRIATSVVDSARGRLTIFSGESLQRVDNTLDTVRTALAIGLPLLVILVAILSWAGTKRALRPVEEIRAEVAEITATDLHRRVPEPTTGDEISGLAVTMNEMLDRLEGASQRQARFVADASHELRSPVTSLRAQLEIGLSRPDRTDWTDRAQGALADADRLETLISDLLLLSRLDAASRPRRTRCDIVGIARDELDRIPPGVGLEVNLDASEPAFAFGNRDQLARAIRNLVDNARRHARSRVDVVIARDRSNVVVDVVDDGPGIPIEDRDRIFERFVRLDEARTTDTGGSGLGLAIVREIVAAHEGTVALVESEVGARLRMVLPAWTP
jgi:signal transduction histidine kinase